MTVRVFRSTDASAPALSGRPGSFVSLLDACLVDGYTGKPAAGWTKPYTGPVGGRPNFYTAGAVASSAPSATTALSSGHASTLTIVFLQTNHASDTTYTVDPAPGSGWTNLASFRYGPGNQHFFNVWAKPYLDSAPDSFTYFAKTSPGGAALSVSYSLTWVHVDRFDVDDLTPWIWTDAAAVASTSIPSSPVTTLNTDDLVITGLVLPDNTATITQPAGYTNQGSFTNVGTSRFNLATMTQAAVGSTGSPPWTRSSNPAGDGRVFSLTVTSPQTANTRRAYRQGGAAANKYYMQVSNAGYHGQGSHESSIRMAETLSAWDTGTNLFPAAGTAFFRVSDRCTTAPRQWVILADERTMIMMVKTLDSPGVWFGYYFGDISSWLAVDDYACAMIARQSSVSSGVVGLSSGSALGFHSGGHFHFLLRGYTQTGSGKDTVGKLSDVFNFQGQVFGGFNAYGVMSSNLPFPNPQNGGIYAAPIFFHEQHNVQTLASVIRGKMRGTWAYCHDYTTISDGEIFAGSGDFAGKTLQYFSSVFSADGNQSKDAGMFLEISDTWD